MNKIIQNKEVISKMNYCKNINISDKEQLNLSYQKYLRR